MQASATACNAGRAAADRPASAGSKPVLASTWPYQCGAQMPSGMAARRPAQHAGSQSMPSAQHSCDSIAARIGQAHRRCRPPAAHGRAGRHSRSKNSSCSPSRNRRAHRLALPRHRTRPCARDRGSERHGSGPQDRRARSGRPCGAPYASGTRPATVGRVPAIVVGDLAPVGSPSTRSPRPPSDVGAGLLEVGAVEGLVVNEAVGPAGEAAHHRGREVARSRPHGDAQGHGRPVPRCRVRAARYSPCSRSTIGPRSVRSRARRSSRPARPGKGAGDERLVGAIDIGQREIRLERRDAGLARHLEDLAAGDPVEAIIAARRPDLAARGR